MIMKNHIDFANSVVPRVFPVPKTVSQVNNMNEAAIDSVLRALGVDECIIAYEELRDKRLALANKTVFGK